MKQSKLEQQFQMFVENSLVGNFRTNLEGDIIYANNALVTMFGFDSFGDAIKQNSLNRYRNPADRAHLLDSLQQFGRIDKYEVEFIDKLGKPIHTLMCAILEENEIYGVLIDITEKKRTEKSLTQTTEQYESLFRYANVGIALHDIVYDQDNNAVDYRLTDVNPAYTDILGLAKDDVIGHTAKQIYQTDIVPYLDVFANVAKRGKPTTFETYFKPMDKHFQILVYCPKAGSFATVFSDISVMKQTEMELRESEHQFKILFEEANEAIFVFDYSDQFHLANSKACKSLGYSKEELLHLTTADIDTNFVSSKEKEWIWKNSPLTLERQHRKKDGSTFPVEVNLSKITFRGNTMALALVSDITDRKMAEQVMADSQKRLSDILEFLPDATWVIDLKGQVIAWNHAIERLTGIKKEDILGKGQYAYAVPFYGEPRPVLIDLVLNWDDHWGDKYLHIKEQDSTHLRAESFHPGLGENGLYLATTAAKIFNSKGDVIGAIESIRDISDSKIMEQEREQLIKELQAAIAKVQTLSGMLPICSNCKKIRDDKGYWSQIESYISQYSNVNFSHGMCPECAEALYGKEEWYKKS